MEVRGTGDGCEGWFDMGGRVAFREPTENGECRFRRRSASDTSTGSGVCTELKFGGGGGIFVGSKVS